MTLTTGRLPRRTLLIGLAAIFTVGNLIAELSGSYAMLLFARIITSLNHGAFFDVGSIVAAIKSLEVTTLGAQSPRRRLGPRGGKRSASWTHGAIP